MSKWLKAGRTRKILSCFGNSFSAEMRSSFHRNEFSTPASVPYIHSEYSLIFPVEAFPNNMTNFSCALRMENYNPQTFSLSKLHIPQRGDLVETTVESLLEPRQPLWTDSLSCETLQMGSHTLSCPNDRQYHQSHNVKTSDVTEREGTSLIKIMKQMGALMGGWSKKNGEVSQGWRYGVCLFGETRI